MEIKFSFYENKSSLANSEISLDNYIGFVQHGANQDLVLKARALKSSGDIDGYKKLKGQSKLITASCTFISGLSKEAKNISSMNGVMVLDLDDEQVDSEKYYEIRNDKHTLLIHRSFSGDNFCVFVKVDPNKFEDSFFGLAEYYFNNFDITIDQSCKNKNRLRYLSFDPDIFHNPKSVKFIPKDVKRFKEPKNVDYIFHEDDFDNLLGQIRDRSLDLCQEDYFRYIRIGIAIASKFGDSGLEKFKFVCQFGGKYNERSAERDYRGFVKNGSGICTIATFYYYCKEAGLEVYSEKTKTIINRVKVGKSQGKPTVSSIVSNLKVANGITANDSDKDLIKSLIESNTDFSKEANKDISDIEQLQNFILDTYTPSIDVITNISYINKETHLTDTEVNDIYLNCKKNFEFNVNIGDVRSVLNSNSIKKVNALQEFLDSNKSDPKGFIEQYAKCIHPQKDYNTWAFKKWIVGALHNWTAGKYEKLVCPLTLVLTGQQHGTGKTSFLRNVLPSELNKYIVEAKINGHDKDSMYTLCNALLVLDDEFGGKAFKDVKEYKAISDMNIVTQRRPYERESKTFKRRAILCGTTNEIDVLKDVTGNRRILPCNVESIDYDTMLAIDKTSLIIEAYNLLKSGFEWIIRTEADIQYIKDNSEENELVLPVEEIFFNHFSLSQNERFSRAVVLNQGEILEYLNNYSIIKPTKYDLKEVLTKNKLTYKQHRISAGQLKKGILLYVNFNENSQNLQYVP